MDHSIVSYPMGPCLRKWLGIAKEDYRGEENSSPSSEEKSHFMNALESQIIAKPVGDVEELVDLVDELVSMKIPMLGVKLIDLNEDNWDRTDFRRSHTEGIASMLMGDLERAELSFRHAQNAQPSEPASYANLVQICLHTDRVDEAWEWARLGLQAEANHRALWQWIGELIYVSQPNPEEYLSQLAKSHHSWVGASFAADMQKDASEHSKAKALQEFYAEGERSLEFLLEYTGALGQAGYFEQISPIVWQVRKSQKERLPWNLLFHDLQAKMGLNQWDAFHQLAQEIFAHPSLPQDVREHLENLIEEIQKEQSAETTTSQGEPIH